MFIVHASSQANCRTVRALRQLYTPVLVFVC
jgi:hypothetical protein